MLETKQNYQEGPKEGQIGLPTNHHQHQNSETYSKSFTWQVLKFDDKFTPDKFLNQKRVSTPSNFISPKLEPGALQPMREFNLVSSPEQNYSFYKKHHS